MVSGNTEVSATAYRAVSRLARRYIAAWFVSLLLSGLAWSAVLFCNGPAAAQVPTSSIGTDVTVPSNPNVAGGTVITTTGVTVGSTGGSQSVINGGFNQGYFVADGASLTINNSLLQDFTTTGGSGSGGGLGAGGAIFIDTGGSVTLNGVSFSGNTAIGGTGGTSSSYGGTLNNITTGDPLGSSTNGTNGANGIVHPDVPLTPYFGDGKGNGVAGYDVGNGGNATNGFGGNGGSGGAGTDGWNNDPAAVENMDIAIQKVSADTGKVVVDGVNVTAWVLAAIAEYSSEAQPFTNPLSGISGSFSLAKGILQIASTLNDSLALAADTQTLIEDEEIVNNWESLAAAGLAGNGGPGETGGNGGKGSYGFGGGAGGQGGAYGLTTVGPNSLTDTLDPGPTDGAGGNGGAGGAGGFGGGGGAGGYGFGAKQNGCGANTSIVSTGCTSSSGSGGAGGTAGFGGGVGSKGGVTGVSNASGGGGGDGYGGAIFVNSGASLTITGNSTFSGNSAIGGASLNGGLAGGTAGTDLFMMQGSTVIIAPGATTNNTVNVVTFDGTIADNSVGSIGAPSVPQTAGYPVTGGASVAIYSGRTIFNGANTYSGQTVINGGALGNLTNSSLLNPGTNTVGAPNYALTDGALQATDGVGLPTASNLNFSGPSQFTGGVLQVAGTVLSNGVVEPTLFERQVNANPNPDGGGTPGGVQWTGSGGFAALNAPLTVTLNNNAELNWGQSGFVPTGYSLMFGSADSNSTVTFTSAIDISGGSYANGTAASILVGNNGTAAGSTAIMSGVISSTTSSGDLSVGGGGFNGTVILTAPETYTGGTYINSGTLELSGNGSIADSSGVFIEGPGTFVVTNSNTPTQINTLSGSGTVSLNGGELQINQTSTFNGVFVNGSSPGSLIVNGSGTVVTLSGTNTYTGDTTINAGATLALTGIGSIADSSPVIDNGTFDISQSTGGAMITTLSGSGTGTVALGSNALLITNGGAGANGTSANGVFSGVFSGVISDGGIACTSPPGGANCTGGELAIAGGAETLAGANTYTGTTTIFSGATLALQGSGSIAASAGVLDYGTFDISLTTTGASITTLAGTGTTDLGSKTLKIAAASTTYSGVIADGGFGGGTGGNLEIGGGTETLTGTNTYTGTTTIDGGADLALSGTGSISQSSGVIDNGLFDISQTLLGAAITTLSGTGNVALGSTMLVITNGGAGASGHAAPGVFSGVISDSGGAVAGTGGMLAVSGGVETLAGVNTYTGGTLIESGATLALSGSGSIAASAGVFDDGTFDISQTTSPGASIQTLLGNGTVLLGAQELTITNGSTTFSGVIADGGFAGGTGGSLIISGGTETLTGANTYTGTTTIDAGTRLALAGTGSIQFSSDIIDNGIFDISQTTSGASIETLSGGTSGIVGLGGQTLTITNGSTTFSGVIADGGIVGGSGGSLTVAGGTQTLTGVNTYTGLTTIDSGATLALSDNGSVSQSSGVVANGTFDISAVTSIIASNPSLSGTMITTLSGGGNVALGGNYLAIIAGAAGPDGTNPAGIFSGVIAGSGGVIVSGSGSHEELTGVNTYTGGTAIINGGTLSANNSNSLGANTSQLVINNGTLVVDASITIPQPISFGNPGPNTINLNSNNVTLSGALTGPGGFTASNGGTLNLTGTTNGLGTIILGPGTTLTASSSASSGLGSTPIIVVPPSGGGGSPTDVFTGSAHVVGPLEIVNGATPELIILPGDTLAGNGGVNIKIVIQGGGTNNPGDAPGTITVSAPVLDLANSTYAVQIDGPLSSFANCPAAGNPNGCANNYATTVVTGSSNTYTAAGTLAPTMTGWGAPGPLPSNYIPPVTSSFIIVQAQGGVLGSFSGLTQPALGVPGTSGGLAPGTRLDALYYNTGSATPITANAASSPNGGTASQYGGNPNAIALWVTPAEYTNLSAFGVKLNQNQTQVAGALDVLRGPAGVRNTAQATWDFGYLFSVQPQSLPGVMDTLTGEVNADAAEGAFRLTDEFLELMLDPSARPVSDDSYSAAKSALGFADSDQQPQSAEMPLNIAADYDSVKAQPRPASFDQRWMTWGAGFGGDTYTDGSSAAGTHDFSTAFYGFAAGMDYASAPGSRFGFAVSGGGDNWAMQQANLGTGSNYNFQAGLYDKVHFGSVYFGAALSVANDWMKTNRIVSLAADPLKASFDAQTYGARVEAGYDFAYEFLKFTPFAAGQVLAFRSPNFGETDSIGGFGLNFAANTETDLSSQLGVRLADIAAVGQMPLILRGSAAWEHDWVNNAGLTATFQAGLPGTDASFVVNGAALPQNLAVISAGAELFLTNSTSINTKFDGEIGSGSQTYGGSATLRTAW
jgi:fibronectin-binding autotransporter adhesin